MVSRHFLAFWSSSQAIEQKRQQNNWRRVQARFARQQAKEERVCANRRALENEYFSISGIQYTT